jgi:hypothetical protein
MVRDISNFIFNFEELPVFNAAAPQVIYKGSNFSVHLPTIVIIPVF